MKDRIEAVLFAAGKFVDEEHIAKLTGEDIRRVRKALAELKEDYDKREGTSLQVVQEEKSWKLHVKDAYLELVSKLVSDKEIATTVLETLAVIAWKSPAMQAEVIKIRGPAAYEHIAELIERGFVTKQPEGRTFKLGVTDKFFDYFDIEGKENLHKLFQSVGEAAAAKQAEIDKAEAEYQAQKQAAAVAQAAIDAGEAPPVNALKDENTHIKASEHSAQTMPASVASLIKEAADELNTVSTTLDETPAPNPREQTAAALAQVKQDLQELGAEVEKLKTIPSNQMPLHKRSPRKH